MIFRQLFDRVTCTYTYLLGDPASGKALLIDPVVEHVDRDLGLLDDLGLTLGASLDTHVHADHVTAAWMLKQRTGSQIVFPTCEGCTPDQALGDGDRFTLGAIELEARHTPGHTSCSTTYVLADHSMAFTGDTLLIRGCGRTDFQGGSSADLYRNVHEKIFSLPDACLLYPGHDYKGRTVTTVDEERRVNPRLGGGKTLSEFQSIMDNLGLDYPERIDVAVPANRLLGQVAG